VQLAGDNYLVKHDMIVNLAKIYAMTGNYPEAIRQVEYLLTNPSWFSMSIIRIDPSWKKLSETPEFKTMTRGTGNYKKPL